MEPCEVVAQPFTLYVAPVGTAFPDVDTVPGAPWTKVGTSGDLNYSEEGVTVSLSQTIEAWRSLGSTGPRKAFRTEEELRISLQLADLTLEQLATALNFNTVSTVAAGAGTPGWKEIGLSRGLSVTPKALLVRGNLSPYGDTWAMQWEIPVAVEAAAPELVFVKGEPALVALEFLVIEDPDAATPDERHGRLVCQNATALP